MQWSFLDRTVLLRAVVPCVVAGTFAFAAFGPLQAQTVTSVWDGAYTAAQAARGQTAYNEHCASCHGDDLTGRDMASALAGPDFTANWDDLTLDDLFERMRATMPADAPRSLTRAQYADIVSYILSKNAFPVGASEVSTENDALKKIKILASKP